MKHRSRVEIETLDLHARVTRHENWILQSVRRTNVAAESNFHWKHGFVRGRCRGRVGIDLSEKVGRTLLFSALVLLRRLALYILNSSERLPFEPARHGLQSRPDVSSVHHNSSVASADLAWKVVLLTC